MDKSAFLREMNISLGLNPVDELTLTGFCGAFKFTVTFEGDDLLTVSTQAKIISDPPQKNDMQNIIASSKLFKDFEIDGFTVTFKAELQKFDDQELYDVNGDIFDIANSLPSMMYESPVKPAPGVTAPPPEPLEPQEITKMPAHVGKGLLGALLGAAGSMVIFVLISLTNYMMLFLLGAVGIAIIPLVLYEIMSKDRISAVELVICSFSSILAFYFGDRIIWTFSILKYWEGVSFSEAYAFVPYLVQSGAVEWFDYYQDYIFGGMAILFMYIFVIRFFLKGYSSIAAIMSTPNGRR